MDKKFEIVKTQKQSKSYKDVKTYEVARFEFGDYDNWVNAIILDIKFSENTRNKGWNEIEICFCLCDGREFTCYNSTLSKDYHLDIIGYAVEKEKTNDGEGRES